MELERRSAPKRRKADEPGPVQASTESPAAAALAVSNQAAVGLLAKKAPESRQMREGQVTSLQASSGNRSVARLIEGEPSPFADLEQTGAAAVNELAIVHDLRRAIDDNPSLEGGWQIKVKKKIKFEIVDHALSNLTPSQVKKVEELYERETGRSLRTDLLDESKIENDLNAAQMTRIKALLAGTALETGGSAEMAVGMPGVDEKKVKLSAGDAGKVTARNRAMADAAEIKLLIDDGGDEAVKKLMGMLRKSRAANDYIAAFYESEFGKELEGKLARLKGKKGERALALRYGSWERADAIAIDEIRERVDEFDKKNILAMDMSPKKAELKKEREKLVAEIEEVLATITQEASAGGGSADAVRTAVAEQISRVLAMKLDDDDDAESVGELLKKTMKAPDLGVVEALATGDPVEAAAARLARSDASDEVNAKIVVETLRGLHDRAEADVQRDIKKTALELKRSGMSPEQLTAAIQLLAAKADEETSLRAKDYTARLKTRIDQMADPDGAHHRFAQIVEDFDSGDKFVVGELMEAGGKLAGLEELEVAVGNSDLSAVARHLRTFAPAARRALVAQFDNEPINKAMGVTLKGLAGGKTISSIAIGDKPIKLPRTDAEAEVAELIEAPDPGGEAELNWTYKWVRDTYERALGEGGITGKIEDVGGRKVRTMLDDSANETIDAITMYRDAITPEEQQEAIRRIHNARATITGDKTAYVADTDAARARIASELALVVDIAVTILLPESAEFTTKIAAALIANIGTKVLVMQDQYTLSDLKADVVGAVVGAGLGSPSRLAGEEATKLIGAKLAAAAERNGLKIAPELRALGGTAVKAGGELAENYMTIRGTNEALGNDPNAGMGEGMAMNIAKGHFTHTVRGMVHGPAGGGGSGGSSGGESSGGEQTTVPASGGGEETTSPAAKTQKGTGVGEEATVPSGTPGEQTGGQTLRGTGVGATAHDETPTVQDEERTLSETDDEATDVKPTPMALDTEADVPVRGATPPAHSGAGGGANPPGRTPLSPPGRGGGGGASPAGEPPAMTVPERGRTPTPGGSKVEHGERFADHGGTPAGETAPRPTTVANEGPTPRGPGLELYNPQGGAEPTLTEPHAQEIHEGPWTEVPAPIPQVSGQNPKIFLRDPLGRIWLFKAGETEASMKFGPEVGIEQGQRWRRAVPMAILSGETGFGTPETRAVTWKNQKGSLQVWNENLLTSAQYKAAIGAEAYQAFLGSQAMLDMDAFDFFVGNQDRHNGNWMVRMNGAEPEIVLIDQDAAIPASSQRGLHAQEKLTMEANGRKVTYDDQTWVRDLPPRISEHLEESFRRLNDRFPDDQLREFLTEEEVQGLKDRLSVVIQKLDSGRIQVVPDATPTQ